MDSYTFCTALGKEEANRQLRRHWRTWVNETYIAQLAELGVDVVRIPVGDWMYLPYEPYIGCWDGALEELDRVLHMLKKHGMKALIDVHAVKGGANGMDNGGRAMNVEWLSSTRFQHWNVLSQSWLGRFNLTTQTYEYIDYENLNRSLQVVEIIAKKYAKHSVVMGIEPGSI
jgi:glucan 1,3-beta-glucosidase